MMILDVLKAVFGGIFVLFLPGFIWSFVFFFKREIDWVERIGLSLGLSIAIVPLTVFWLNWLFHVRITLLNSSLAVLVLSALPAIYLLVKRPTLREDVAQRMKDMVGKGRVRQAFRRRKY